jgi:hypothetical protein
MTLTLYYRYQNATEKLFSASDPEVVIGRPSDTPVHLDLSPDTRVSRPHARLFYELSTWWVEDLRSKHGTMLNDQCIHEATQVSPGDQLQLGDTFVRVEFVTRDAEPGSGTLDNRFISDEIQPPPAISEDKRLEVLAKISIIAAHSRGQAMLERFLDVIAAAFPQSERRTIMLIENRELVPRVFWPPAQSYISFTLARQAITSQEAFQWIRQPTSTGNAYSSLFDTTTALYAPLLCQGRAVGVIHLDTTAPEVVFSSADVQLLSVIANTIGSAITAGGRDGISIYPSVFISYAHHDRTFVNGLAAHLRRRRVIVWFDEHLQTGTAWREQLTAAIENAGAFVLVMSPQSVGSEYVQWELAMAQSVNKKIFPLLYVDCDVPDTIEPIQFIDIRANFEAGVHALAHELHNMLRQSPDRAASEEA